MAKLFSSPSEAIALRALCSPDRVIAGHMLARVDQSFFHLDESREAYNYILAHVSEKGGSPPFNILVENVSLSEDAREHLKQAKVQPKRIKEADQLIDNLQKYRQTRIYWDLAKSLKTKLEAAKIDPLELAELVSKQQNKAQAKKSSVDDRMFHIGKKSNVAKIVHNIIHGEDTDNWIPTRFSVFDDINGGFPRGGLVTLGGASSSGKSHLVIQLALNQALLGYKVVVVPLEMTEEEYLIRTMANVSKTDSLRISRKQLTSEEKATVERRFANAQKKIDRAGGRISIYVPDTDMSIEEIMAAVHSYGADAVYIDYIGLLKGADGDDQWRKLGQISRYAKVYANNHNKVVVLACQVDETGKIRYSQAIKEHSSLAWIFVATKESRERGFLNFSMLKGRNQKMIDFTLRIDYEYSRLYDPDPSDMDKSSNMPNEESGKKKSDMPDEESFVPDLSD